MIVRNKKPTLCWTCKRYYKKCSWSKKFRPVVGWKAIPTKLKTEPNVYIGSYLVIECPKYIGD